MRITKPPATNSRAAEIDVFNYGFDAGKKAERERIIKLLEQWLDDDYGDFDRTLDLINEKEITNE